jgi:D-glycero-D-manno-heptose 1,7-bisphosphate phosphatase
MHPAIFLDRDGVIIENRPHYVRSWQDVEFIPGSLQAIVRASALPYKIVIITNQAGIAKGLIAPTIAEEINRCLIHIIQQAGGRVDGLYMCPHKPEDDCDCRKPRPGLLIQASQALHIYLSSSILIGDNLSDLQAGQAAGISQLFLVQTGLGAQFSGQLALNGLAEVQVFKNLAAALEKLIS